MAKVEKFARIVVKSLQLDVLKYSGVTATIPPSNDHTTLPTWLDSDIYIGEFLLNSIDRKLYFRLDENTIKTVAFYEDLSGHTFGSNGTSGTNGTSGSSGLSGVNGTSGSSGLSGVNGTGGGTSGSSGLSGVDGTSGSSGLSGVNGTGGGTSGSSGLSGVDGTSGSSGLSGVDGVDGTSGSSGTNGTSGSSGLSGVNGTGGDIYTNLDPMPITVGGLVSGTTFSAQTITDIFDNMFYPELFPTLVSPSSTFSITLNPYYEVGSLIGTLTFNSTFNRGLITPAYTTNGYRSGPPTSYNYTGSGLTNTITSSLSDFKQIPNYVVLYGPNSWGGNVSYTEGEQPLSSKLNDYNSPLPSGNTTTLYRTFNGIYPFLYGMNENILDGNNLYSTFSPIGKLIQPQGDKTVLLNGNFKYIYFAYPSSYSDLVRIYDVNGFDVLDTFDKYIYDIVSYGLSSNWVVSYKIYRTNDPTTVINGSFIFKFN